MKARDKSGARPYLRFWSYWLIFMGGITFAALVAAAAGPEVGLNPYVAAAIGGGLFVLYETWQVARHRATGDGLVDGRDRKDGER